MKKEPNTKTEEVSRAKAQATTTGQHPEDRRKLPLSIMDNEDDTDQAEVLPLITIRDYYDLLMEQQEQM